MRVQVRQVERSNIGKRSKGIDQGNEHSTVDLWIIGWVVVGLFSEVSSLIYQGSCSEVGREYCLVRLDGVTRIVSSDSERRIRNIQLRDPCDICWRADCGRGGDV